MFQLMCQKKKSYNVSHFLWVGGVWTKSVKVDTSFFFPSENFPKDCILSIFSILNEAFKII